MSIVGLYPRAWRDRYGDEMQALIEAAPLRRRDRLDLARGALDAWLHPAMPSRVPAVAALVGGGLWTVAAAAVVFQPAPPQWPGYILEILGLALVAAVSLLVATLGCLLRAADGAGRSLAVAVVLAVAGYLAWLAALAATVAGAIGGPELGAAQTVAMMATVLVGSILVRAGDQRIGLLVMLGPVAMLIPWNVSWLVLGASWTAVGCVLLAERSRRPGPGGWRVS